MTYSLNVITELDSVIMITKKKKKKMSTTKCLVNIRLAIYSGYDTQVIRLSDVCSSIGKVM